MQFDLHVHSTASDGALSPAQLVESSLCQGLTALAITDHDSVEGIGEALSAAEKTDLIIIPGVELSASWNGTDLHILGYFIDPANPSLIDRLVSLRQARTTRARKMVARLRDSGIMVQFEDVLNLAGSGSLGRSHIARALVAGGLCSTASEAFSDLIGHGRPFYIPKPEVDPAEVIESIIAAGGVAVFAHPGVHDSDECIPYLVEAGLGGIEVYHPLHTHTQKQHYTEIADKYGLLLTGGSDFHGFDSPGGLLGGEKIPVKSLIELLKLSENHR